MNKKDILKIKKYFFIIGSVFLVSFLFGLIFNYSYPNQTEEFFSEINKQFSFISGLNFYFTFLFIFFNNTVKVFISMILGVFFGVIPILFTIINGFVLGIISGYVYPVFGLTGLLVSILPHGIFELFGLFLGGGLGLFLGTTTYREIKEKRLTFKSLFFDFKKFNFSNQKIKSSFSLAFDIFISLALPGLLLAAMIEAMLIFWL